MSSPRTVVSHSGGTLRFVPIAKLWDVAGLLADELPLDRESTYPRPLRRFGHWARLLVFDRAVTNDSRSAVMTLGNPVWAPMIAASIAAVIIAPRLPRAVRWSLGAAIAAWALRGGRWRRAMELHRALAELAPGAVVVGDFVGRRPGVGIAWAADALRELSDQFSFVALLPSEASERRNRARERIYTRRLGFRVAGRAQVGGDTVIVLVYG